MTRLMDTLEAILIRKVPGPRTAIQREFQSRMKAVTDLVQEVFDGSAAAIVNELPFQEREVGFRLPGHSEAIKGMLSSTVIESHGAVSLPVSERGTGFQSALVLGILRYVAQRESRNGTHLFFAVEEPEAFLHPQTQRAMAQVLRHVAEDAQLLVTTHSPVLVDSFSIDKVARLPLQQGGTTFEWSPPTLDTAEEGRLTRYCTAANSELVFASTVVFVEGVGDKDVIDLMLGDIYNAVGGHYAHGVSVIAAEGLTNIKHLVSLAELFGVQSYVLSDKDGLHGERDLLKVLSGRPQKLSPDVRSAMIGAVDKPNASIEAALQQQADVNVLLEASGAFILSSDLEGLLLDALGVPAIIQAIGPQGEGSIDAAFAGRLGDQSDGDAYATLGAWLGTKGWNSDRRRTGKMKPHLAPLLYREISSPSDNPVIAPLREWLERITNGTTTAPL